MFFFSHIPGDLVQIMVTSDTKICSVSIFRDSITLPLTVTFLYEGDVKCDTKQQSVAVGTIIFYHFLTFKCWDFFVEIYSLNIKNTQCSQAEPNLNADQTQHYLASVMRIRSFSMI